MSFRMGVAGTVRADEGRVKAEKRTNWGENRRNEAEKGSSLPSVRLAAREDLFRRFGDSRRIRQSFEECRRELAPAYIEYIFTVSSGLHAASLQLSSLLLVLCRAARPSSVADLGSGFSSYVLRTYTHKAAHPVRVTSVDDSPSWLAKTREFLEQQGRSGEGLLRWDEVKRRGTSDFDLILYDLGTMRTRARELTTVLDGAKPGALIVLDDLHYRAYRELVEKVVSEQHLLAYDLEDLTRDEYGRFAWVVGRSGSEEPTRA
jgi:predicted O-methyltransferase YrrM